MSFGYRVLGFRAGSSAVAAFSPDDLASCVAYWPESGKSGRWQNAGKTTPADDSGEDVHVWEDIVGALDWVYSSGTKATIAANGSIRFEGNTDQAVYTASTMAALGSGELWVVLEKDADPPAAGADAGLWQIGNNAFSDLHTWTDGNSWLGAGIAVRVGPSAITTDVSLPHVLRIEVAATYKCHADTGTSPETFINSGGQTVSWETSPVLGLSLGARYLKGNMAAMVIFNAALSGDDLTNVYTWARSVRDTM